MPGSPAGVVDDDDNRRAGAHGRVQRPPLTVRERLGVRPAQEGGNIVASTPVPLRISSSSVNESCA
jgi:hypothetical protein